MSNTFPFPDKPRVFKMIRNIDLKHISGTGHVIDGVVFANGQVVIQWQTETKSLAVFDKLSDFQKVHAKPMYEKENEFVWYDGYEPSSEVNQVCDQIVEFIMNFEGTRLTDHNRGKLIGKVLAIKEQHEHRQNKGIKPSKARFYEHKHEQRRGDDSNAESDR